MNVNILVLIILICVIFKVADGYKKGMVKEIISFISLIVMCVVVLLLSTGLHSYMEKEYIGVVVAILLLVLLGIAHHVLKLFFFSAKLVSKLPIIHSCDKLLGMVTGVLEVLIVLWTVYTFIQYFEMGVIGSWILEYSKENTILNWFYEHNILASMVENVLSKIR